VDEASQEASISSKGLPAGAASRPAHGGIGGSGGPGASWKQKAGGRGRGQHNAKTLFEETEGCPQTQHGGGEEGPHPGLQKEAAPPGPLPRERVPLLFIAALFEEMGRFFWGATADSSNGGKAAGRLRDEGLASTRPTQEARP
jgi:hypothetical protein